MLLELLEYGIYRMVCYQWCDAPPNDVNGVNTVYKPMVD